MLTVLPPLMRAARPRADQRGSTLCLRVLATTDLHMELTGYDYHRDAETGHHGLAGLASLINDARAEADTKGMATVLLDNGDLVQGGAMGAWLAQRPVTRDHPVVNAMNTLRYNAIGIGNHDLDFGTAYLHNLAGVLDMPLIGSNLSWPRTSAIRQTALISCDFPVSPPPHQRQIRIGVVSALPPETRAWSGDKVEKDVIFHDMRQSIIAAASALRGQGADVVILLAHMGAKDLQAGSAPLADISGIDAVIMGHTHECFPPDQPCQSRPEHHSMIGPLPAIMPGHHGSHLGVLDLTLDQTPDGTWQVITHQGALRSNDRPPDPALQRSVANTHAALQKHLARPIARLDQPIHNYFSLAAPTPTCALIAHSKIRAIKAALHGRPEAKLPILATAAADTAGGKAGAAQYLDMPAGLLLRRHVNGLCPYSDQILALRSNGREIRRWLEHAASVFHQLQADPSDQPLLRADRPAYDFITIFGIRYQIDPSRPDGERISALCYDSNPLPADQEVILVTTEFRAGGGGGYPKINQNRLIPCSPVDQQSAVVDLLNTPPNGQWITDHPWQFVPDIHRQAMLKTNPKAADHLDELAHLDPRPCGITADGFLKLRLTL
jgi:2',3'-cyclic-nucleotide 2'-phosphodiesterase/3'-nucleotidase